jgi:hypothetical protein
VEQTESTIDWLKENWQGQSFIPFALEIPVGEFDTPSKISIDYKKYGYTVMDDAIIQSNEDHDMNNMKVASTVLHWQNKFMNIMHG